MPGIDLHTFIANLESEYELSRIVAAVDPVLEIAAITDRVCKSPGGGKALLFEKPSALNFPVTTNLFGSERRVCLALGTDNLDLLTDRMRAILDQIPDVEFDRLDQQISALPEFFCFTPCATTDPDPNLITMDPPDLTVFPFLQSWPEDGSASGHGRYITLTQVFTADPDGGTPNCGLYRVQVRGPAEIAIQWKSGSGAFRHAELYRELGQPMPVAIALGGDPAMLFSGMFPLPGNLDEVTFAGFLRKYFLQTSPGSSVPLAIPTGAEIVIEGYLNPGEPVMEGPFGNHTGCYSPAAPAALMRVTSVRHRPDAIVPATVVGQPPMEDCWMAKAWERLQLAFIQKLIPAVIDIHFPFEWIFHQSAVISLENPCPGMVGDTLRQLWALPWFTASKILIFVDAESERNDLQYAAWKAINVTNFSEDIYHDKTTGRVAVDATGCRQQRPELKIPFETEELVARRWKEYRLP